MSCPWRSGERTAGCFPVAEASVRGLDAAGSGADGQEGAAGGTRGAGSGTSSRSQAGVMFCEGATARRGLVASACVTGARTARICPVSHVESGVGAERGAICGASSGAEYVGYRGDAGYVGNAGNAGRETGAGA